jgi:ligand-binding sensor domain-containing protein
MLTVFFLLAAVLPHEVAAVDYPGWEGYPPLYNVNDITMYSGEVYGVTEGGFFRYDPATESYRLYYKNHGLVGNRVNCVAQAGSHLYLGFQENGLWKYDPDADSFEQILFPEYHVKTADNSNGIALNHITAVNDSVLYIAHANGVDYLNLVTEEIRVYTNLGDDLPANTPVNEVRLIDGRIWACTGFGVAVADADDANLEFPGRWENYEHRPQTALVGLTTTLKVEDQHDEAVYIGTQGTGILSFLEEELRLDPTALSNGSLNRLYSGLERSWGGGQKGLYMKVLRNWQLYNNKYSYVTSLVSDNDRTLWLGTARNGLQCFVDSTYSFGWKDIPQPTGMNKSLFYTIDIGDTGVLWAATSDRDNTPKNLTHRLQGDEWTVFSEEDAPWTNRASDFLQTDDGRVWVTIWGANKVGVRKSAVFVFDDAGTPATEDDVTYPVDEQMVIFKPTVKKDFAVCTSIDQDGAGNIWVANFQENSPLHAIEAAPSSGAVVVDGYPITKFQHYSPADDGLATAQLMVIKAGNDNWIWCGTFNSGLIGIFVGDDPFDKSDTIVKNLTLEDGLHSMRIAAIECLPDGSILAGSDGGLNRITVGSGAEIEIEDLNDEISGIDRAVTTIVTDPHGTTWIGTRGGIARLDKNFETVAIYTAENSGLFSDGVTSLDYHARDDVLWVGSDAGINRLAVFDTDENIVSDARVYPHPFEIWGSDSSCTFTGLQPGSKLSVFTFTGSPVAVLTAGDENGDGVGDVSWDGRNTQGGSVGTGIFFFTGKNTDGSPFTDKLAVVRR